MIKDIYAKTTSMFDGIIIANSFIITYFLSLGYLIIGLEFFLNVESSDYIAGKILILASIVAVFIFSFILQRENLFPVSQETKRRQNFLLDLLFLFTNSLGFVFNSFNLFLIASEGFLIKNNLFTQLKNLFKIELTIDDNSVGNVTNAGYNIMFNFWIIAILIFLMVHLISERDSYNGQGRNFMGALFYFLAIAIPVVIMIAVIKSSLFRTGASYFIYFIIGDLLYIYYRNLFNTETTQLFFKKIIKQQTQ